MQGMRNSAAKLTEGYWVVRNGGDDPNSFIEKWSPRGGAGNGSYLESHVAC